MGLCGGDWNVAVVSALLVGLCACSPSVPVRLVNAGPLQSDGRCTVGGGIGVAAEVQNPRGLALTYRWHATAGEVRVASSYVPAGTFECTEPGVQTITVEVLLDGKVVGQKSFSVTVVPPPAVAGAVPTRTSTLEDASTAGQCSGAARPRLNSASIPGEVSIAQPADCAVLSGFEQELSGRYGADVPGPADIWVLVYSHSAERYWPQPQPVHGSGPATGSNGKFNAVFFLGSPSEWYDVIVVLATEEASQVFAETVARWAEAQGYPGLRFEELPTGLDEKASITVYRAQ